MRNRSKFDPPELEARLIKAGALEGAIEVGEEMYRWACDLFPIARSLTGEGVRETLRYIHRIIPQLKILSVPSGTPAFDWIVPDEWTIRDAFIADENGTRIVDFRECNLHVVGYSVPVNCWLEREELEGHLHSIEEQPSAIPYVTSYYERRWGFCISDAQRKSLKHGRYHVVIDSTLRPGVMNYGEIVLPGLDSREILLSTYICHPSMANNELSGPVVATALARWIAATPLKYTYRILFLPETIGAIYFLSKNWKTLKQNLIAGFVLTCCGDDRCYTFLPSRLGRSLPDRVAVHVLRYVDPSFIRAEFLDRGSDERQYCSPGVDLPVVSVMRSMYGRYPEYHTSLDDLNVISSEGLRGSFEVVQKCIQVIEANAKYRTTILAEPHLGTRGLYPTLSGKKSAAMVRDLLNVLAYADGDHDLIDIGDRIGVHALECADIAEKLVARGLMVREPV